MEKAKNIMKKTTKQLLFERMNSIGGMPLKEEEYFNPTLPDDIKRNSNRYEGKNVVWYGDPDQMIVLHKDQVHGMWGNVYDSEKLNYVVELIRNSESKVELECSYGIGDIVTITDVSEEQTSFFGDSFSVDYEHFDDPHTTGDEELDQYLGLEYLDDMDSFYDVDSDSLRFFEKYKTMIANNYKTPQQIKEEMIKVIGDTDGLDIYLNFENELKLAMQNKQGDLGKFELQLRDGHHRVMGAIKAGEEYVCVNLVKEQIPKFQNYITRVTTK